MCIGLRNCNRQLLPTMGTPPLEQFLKKQDRAGPGDELLRVWLDVWVVCHGYISQRWRQRWVENTSLENAQSHDPAAVDVSLHFLLLVYTGDLGFWSMLLTLYRPSFLLPMWHLSCPELSSNTSFSRDALLFSYSWLRFLNPFPFSDLCVSYFPIVF